MHTMQFAPGKSFPGAELSADTVKEMKRTLDMYGIQVAVYGCYVDPLTKEGEENFFRQMEYAAILEAGAIGTETAYVQTPLNETEEKYDAVRDTLRLWVRRAQSYGIPVGIEAVTGFPIHSVEKTKRLLTDISSDYLKIIWDPANLIHEENASRQEEIFRWGLAQYGYRIVAVHYKERPDIAYESSIRFCREHENVPVLLEGIPKNRVLEAVRAIRKRETPFGCTCMSKKQDINKEG